MHHVHHMATQRRKAVMHHVHHIVRNVLSTEPVFPHSIIYFVFVQEHPTKTPLPISALHSRKTSFDIPP
ncbi:hypothetical protein Y032_0010g1033 [Ancylostoma ceylanicum]|uniref:Uncharacterized protein n=1 Tax=Ancylostoma ceylanicum TaxID=53326 RepID=A0A016VF25_9BILA|nr:hypothetical protein Y032_0010g1033 [Ancylostoma ceylanicum]